MNGDSAYTVPESVDPESVDPELVDAESSRSAPGRQEQVESVSKEGSMTIADALDRFATVVSNAQTDRVEAQIPPLVAMLEAAGCDVIVLKGPVTRSRLYGDDERRPVADIDVMVDPASFRRASRALRRVGFERVDRHGHSDAFAYREQTVADHATGVSTGGGPSRRADIDLHLTLPYVTVPPRKAFEVFTRNRTLSDVAGEPVPVLDPPAHVVHLAIHAAVNRFDPASRSLSEWRRGLDSLDGSDRAMARTVAMDLGAEKIWHLACRALQDGADPQQISAELPTWEVEVRATSARRFLESGTPPAVKWRDLQRLVTLQLSDETLNVWRAKGGHSPLESGSIRIRLAKPVRLVTVSARGLGRMVRGGASRIGRARPSSSR